LKASPEESVWFLHRHILADFIRRCQTLNFRNDKSAANKKGDPEIALYSKV
jgi:hypothetical protein